MTAAQLRPRCAATLATGTVALIARDAPLSPPIAAHACSLLSNLFGCDTKGVTAVALLSLAPLMQLFRTHLLDATVAHTAAFMLNSLVLQGAHAHAYHAIARAGALPLLATATKTHMAVLKPDVAEICLRAAMNLSCNDPGLKAEVVVDGLDGLAIQAFLLRGSADLLLASAASGLLGNVMSVPGQREKVLASGVVAAIVPALPDLLRFNEAGMTPSIWGQHAAAVVLLPPMFYNTHLGADDSVAAALVASLRLAVSTPHLEDLDPVAKRLLGAIHNIILVRGSGVAAVFRAHDAQSVVHSACKKFPALKDLAASTTKLLLS